MLETRASKKQLEARAGVVKAQCIKKTSLPETRHAPRPDRPRRNAAG